MLKESASPGVGPNGGGGIGSCKSCGAAVWWARYYGAGGERGRLMPIDARPLPADSPRAVGQLVLYESSPGQLAVRPALGESLADVARYVSHFSTCPNAEAHRRRSAAGGESA